jgi:hypothetical protein
MSPHQINIKSGRGKLAEGISLTRFTPYGNQERTPTIAELARLSCGITAESTKIHNTVAAVALL